MHVRQFAVLALLSACLGTRARVAAHAADQAPLGDGDGIDWQPLAAHHGDRFFRTRAGWTEAHVHRRLQDCSSYIKDITDSKQSLKTFTERLTTVDLTKVSSVAEDVAQAIDFGKDYGGIKFESLMRGVQGVVAGVGGVFSGFAIYGALDDLKEFKAQVNEVFAELTKIHLRVEALPDVIAYQLDRATYRRLVDDGVAQVNAIVNQVNFTDALQASCRSFDDGLVSKLANTIESFTTICTPPNSQPDDVTTDKLRKCYLGIGTSVGGVLAQLVTAMSICISVRSPFASEASVAQLRTAKMRGVQFFGSLATVLRELDGSGSGSGSFDPDVDEKLKSYENSTAEIAADNPESDPRADSFLDAMVEGMNAYNFAGKDYVERIANFTAQEGWKALTASNPEARELGTTVALAIGYKYNQKMDRLSQLDGKIYETHQERVQLVAAADAKVWQYHGQIMSKVGSMGTTFTNQFNQRIDKLQGIQTKVTTVQSNVNSGFASLKGQLDGMRTQWGNQITDIDNEIVKQGGETTSFLSNAVADAAQQVGNRIAGVQDQVVQTHKEVMSALQTTQQRNEQEYVATRGTLQQSSDALRDTIDQGMYSLDSTVRQSFDAVTDAVTRRIEEAHTHLGDMVTGVSRELAFVDNKLMVFNNQVEDMSRQLEAVQLYLHDVNTVFESIAKALADLPASIRAEIFKDRYDHLEDQYMKMRDGYNDFLDQNLTASIMVGSCEAHRPYDLFLSFLELVDISDGDIPRQMERFGHKVQVYERFGLVTLGVLKELAFLDSVCAKLQYGATFLDMRLKAQEQDDLIVAASAALARHVEEMIPAYLLNVRAAELVESYATRDWTTQGHKLAEELRKDLQDSVGTFARVSVIHAGLSGTIDVKHLDTDFDYANAKVARRRGIQASKNKKLAVVWGATKQLQGALPSSLDATALLRKGIFRGNMTVTPPTSKCFLALAPGYYPVCDEATCACSHYEDFASATDPAAGRAVTRFATNDYTSDFVVEAVDDAGVDYRLEAVAFSVKQLPSLKAFAALRAPALNTSQLQRPLWEGYADVGKFEVVVSDVAGVVLAKNELVLDIEMRTADRTIRQAFPLFCDNKIQQATVDAWLVFRYACREVPRTRSSPSASDASSIASKYPVITPGAPTNRLEVAVCAVHEKSKTCTLSGDMDLAAAVPGSALAIGSQVLDVTLFQQSGRTGDFVICRACSTADLATVKTVGSVLMGIPAIPPEFMHVECGQPAGRPNMLYCRRKAA